MAAALAFGSHAGFAATTAYQQAPSGSLIDTSAVKNIVGDPGFTWTLDGDSQAWAYFTATSTASFNTITWYGSSADGVFAVDLFGATCFSCGLSFVQTDGSFVNNLLPSSGTYSGASLTTTALGSNLFSYSISLASAVTLQAGSSYGFSVVNNFTSLPFIWEGSATGSGTHINYVVGRATVLPAPGNLAFALTSSAAAVPEPASWGLMILGVVVVGSAIRSNRLQSKRRIV